MPRSKKVSRRNEAQIATEVLGEKTDQYKRRAEESLEEAKRKFVTAERKVRGYINENPEKALLIAAEIGAAIGSLMTAFLRDSYKGARR